MHRSVHRAAGPYRVAFSPEAWKQIGLMSSATFQGLQLALERIAHSPCSPEAPAQPSFHATVDEVTVVYALDEQTRTLTVLNISRVDSDPA
jgi:hypothetical protein